MNIGFIGTGSMGRAIIPVLIKAGHRVAVWNRSPDALTGLTGVPVLDSPAAAFQQDVVISMLADDRAVDEVLLSSKAVEGARTDCVHVVMSTLSPSLIMQLQKHHHELGIPLVAAPVFGVPAVAARVEMNILVAGPAEAISRVQPLFDVLGKRTWRLGDKPVQACIAKIAGNMMITQAIQSLAEASGLAECYGLSPETFIEVVTQTLFACPSYQRYGQHIVNGTYVPGFKLSLGLKDINLAIDAATATDMPVPAAEVVRSKMRAAVDQGLGKEDWSAFATLTTKPRPTRHLFPLNPIPTKGSS
ncbi:NAD(P)-dependent oxidoreductase [Pseudomonas sp. NPDC078700]|uniref:NAD(P)-dependent oxidoreductase n=1 Tax=Pseudomonas sp. NPDC078700 TaxID=3364424 RepID=UPI0037C55ECA